MGDLMRWLGEQFFQLIGLVGELFNLLCSWWTNLFGAVIGSFLVAVCIIFGRKIFLWRENTREIQRYKKRNIIFFEQALESLVRCFLSKFPKKIGNLYQGEDSNFSLFVGVCVGKYLSSIEDIPIWGDLFSKSLSQLRDEISQYQKGSANEVLDHAGFSSVISTADAFEYALVSLNKAQEVWDIIGKISIASERLDEFRMAVEKFLSYIADEGLKSQGSANLVEKPLEFATPLGEDKGDSDGKVSAPEIAEIDLFGSKKNEWDDSERKPVDVESHPDLSDWVKEKSEKQEQGGGCVGGGKK